MTHTLRPYLWATSTFKGIEVEPGDTVVLSARIIPGNEKNISRLIGHLYKRGANIIEERRRLVHVSGHASQEDIKIMVEMSRPKFVVPIHGEYRMLFRQKEYIKNHVANYFESREYADSYTDDNIVLIENGNVLELDEYACKVVEKHDLHKTFIDEESMDEIEYDVVRERKKLAYGGAISLVVMVDKQKHTLAGDPQITFQGVANIDPLNGFAAEARNAVSEAIREMKPAQIADRNVFKENLRIHLKRYIQKELSSKPVIVTTIVEV